MNIFAAIPEMIRAALDAYTAHKKAAGPDAAKDFLKEADRVQKAQTARDVSALQRALKRRRVLGTSPGGQDKPPAKPTGKAKPR